MPGVEDQLAPAVAEHVLGNDRDARAARVRARATLDVARAEVVVAVAEGLDHRGPAEELRGQVLSPGAEALDLRQQLLVATLPKRGDARLSADQVRAAGSG